jgi:hypothetical protein
VDLHTLRSGDTIEIVPVLTSIATVPQTASSSNAHTALIPRL